MCKPPKWSTVIIEKWCFQHGKQKIIWNRRTKYFTKKQKKKKRKKEAKFPEFQEYYKQRLREGNLITANEINDKFKDAFKDNCLCRRIKWSWTSNKISFSWHKNPTLYCSYYQKLHKVCKLLGQKSFLCRYEADFCTAESRIARFEVATATAKQRQNRAWKKSKTRISVRLKAG